MVIGAVVQVPLGLLHPHQAQPNDSRAAFTEYAHSSDWVELHLGQYVGTLLIAIGLVTMAITVAQHTGLSGHLGRIAVIAALVSTAVFAVQMAVDGVALKAAVDHWTAATTANRTASFDVAEGVRSVEKGLSAFFHLNNGITLLALGVALATSQRPRILGWLGVAAGIGFVVEAVVTAQTGFSSEAAKLALAPTLLLTAFLLWAAWRMWRPSCERPPSDMRAHVDV